MFDIQSLNICLINIRTHTRTLTHYRNIFFCKITFSWEKQLHVKNLLPSNLKVDQARCLIGRLPDCRLFSVRSRRTICLFPALNLRKWTRRGKETVDEQPMMYAPTATRKIVHRLVSVKKKEISIKKTFINNQNRLGQNYWFAISQIWHKSNNTLKYQDSNR